MNDDLVRTLRTFCDAYPLSAFPRPPEDKRARDAAAADVLREVALPWFARAADRIEAIEAENAALQARVHTIESTRVELLGRMKADADRIEALEALLPDWDALDAATEETP